MNQKGVASFIGSVIAVITLIVAFVLMFIGMAMDSSKRGTASVKLQKSAIERCVKDGGMPLFDVIEGDKLRYRDCDMEGVKK